MEVHSFKYHSQSVDDTLLYGKTLANALPRQSAVALHGTLGAGKTLLVQGMASALEIDPATVTSPTFVICNEYIGRKTLIHADVYRLNDTDDFLAIGGDEWFISDAITLIEWAEKIEDCLPSNTHHITISQIDANSRVIELSTPDPSVIKSMEADLS